MRWIRVWKTLDKTMAEEEGLRKIPNDPVQLVFVGMPLLDISAHCDQSVLDEFGLQPDDCVRARDEHDPLFRRLFESPDSRLSAGGSAQNSARVAKWVLRDEGEVSFVGCTGDDEFGTWMKHQLLSEGVSPLYTQQSGAKTGVCACVLNSDGKRSMCTRRGAAALFSTSHLNSRSVRKALKKARCIFVVGYLMGHSPEVVLQLAKDCSTNQIFSLSLSAEYVCRDYVSALLKAMPRVDVLFGNEAEVKAFVQAMGEHETITVESCLRIIRQLPRPATAVKPRIVVVTHGPDSVLMDDGSGDVHAFDVPKNVPVVDSVGCGDALTGAFLATYARTMDAHAALRIGIRAAAEILQVTGCNPPDRQLNVDLK